MVEAIDIEAAYLGADLEDNVFVQWPKGHVEFDKMTKRDKKE